MNENTVSSGFWDVNFDPALQIRVGFERKPPDQDPYPTFEKSISGSENPDADPTIF